MAKLIFFILLPVFVLSQSTDSVDAVVARYMKGGGYTGVSIGIVKNGQVFLSKGYGQSNLELNASVSANTVFKLASVSKHMIAVAILKLAQQGKLSLSDAAIKFFPGAPQPWKDVTIRHLLNHTSGIVRESPGFDPWKLQADTLVIKAAYAAPLEYPTGTKWQYCNVGYFMLADIIRQLGGASFESYMQDSLFLPLGMAQSGVTSTSKIIPQRATGYILQKDGAVVRAADWVALRPSGAFVSSIADMVKWELAIQQDRIIPGANSNIMWADTVSTNRSHPDSPSAAYGFGWFTSLYQGERVVYHGGSLPGFRSIYYRFPESKTAIIILANCEPADLTPLALEIFQRLK